jgi:GMP synthase (glutamine-hydrolysing)
MSHREVVENIGPDITPLAANAYSPHQAIAIGDTVRGVQFHPEYPLNVMQALMANRNAEMADEGLDLTAIASDLKETPSARNVIGNFVRFFVL